MLYYARNSEKSEKKVFENLENFNITHTVMTSARVGRDTYSVPELAGRKPMRILLKDSDFIIAKGFWIGTGYDIEYHYQYYGDLMRNPKNYFDVGVYYRVPFVTKRYVRESEILFQRAYRDSTYQHAMLLPLESNFVFRLAESAYKFVESSLTVRDVIDLYMFYKKWNDKMDNRIVIQRIKRFKTEEIAFSLLHLAYLWFEDPQEELCGYERPYQEVLKKMEENILIERCSHGKGVAQAA